LPRFNSNLSNVAGVRSGAEREHHFPKNLGSGVSFIYIYIYIYFYILYCIYVKKNMQNAKLVAEYMKSCIFVLLVDEYYIIMKLEMPSIVH
jgi:hypothetical protein